MKDLESQIAFITINPSHSYLRSLRAGFKKVGLNPTKLIVVSPKARLKAEWRAHRFGIFHRVLWPKLKALWSSRTRENLEVSGSKLQSFRVSKLNSDETLQLIEREGIRYLINAGAGIFGQKLLKHSGLEILNAHAGALPKYRNMNVLEWALWNRDLVVGTIHLMDSGIDTGPILFEEPIDLSKARSTDEAWDLAFDQLGHLLPKALVKYAKKEITTRFQKAEAGKNWYKMHPSLKARLNDNFSLYLSPVVGRCS